MFYLMFAGSPTPRKRRKRSKKPENDLSAKFICCLTLFWPDVKIFTSKGEIKGKISL